MKCLIYVVWGGGGLIRKGKFQSHFGLWNYTFFRFK